ncbi:radical SAM protein [Rhodospirillum sp. A1_3_36]|uniref:radical SAM protein n=1 Tax=Rhodospirillum sp. A1_3_36 TaxID=3391666 RepID=UPI0039A67D30
MKNHESLPNQDSSIEAFSWVFNIESVSIELTSRCNLRCHYCSVPHSESYGAADMSKQRLGDIRSLLKTGNVQSLSLSGRGELTYMDNWQEAVALFKDAVPVTHAVLNMAKPLTWEEAEAVLQITSFSFSIDTADRELTLRTRKGADLRTVISNIVLLRAVALACGRPLPFFNIIAVMNESSIFGLKKLASLAITLGARTLILQDLVMDYKGIATDAPVGHISTLPQERLREAAVEFLEASKLLSHHQVGFTAHPTLTTIIQEAISDIPPEKSSITAIEVDSPSLGRYRRHAQPLKPGSTRFCTMPWEMLLLRSDSQVEVCCGAYGETGSYDGIKSLTEIANLPAIRRLRKELLTGEVNELCAHCSSAPETSVSAFQEHIRTLYASAP